MADYNSRCLWCREHVVPLKADEHPGESMGCCYIDIFKCDFVIVFVRERTAETDNPNTTKEDTQNTIFVLALWSGLDSVLHAIVMFLPSVLGHFCYVSSKLGPCACACGAYVWGFYFSAFQPPICACSQWNQWMCTAFFLSFSLPRQCRA